VPSWHPIYRNSYSLERLAEQAIRETPVGLWDAQSGGRLATQDVARATFASRPSTAGSSHRQRLHSRNGAIWTTTAPVDR
jgi:hypothetical protein